MSADDLLANVERGDKPVRIVPALPDIDAPDDYPFHGSATGEIERWRRRALVAEAHVERLIAALRRHRFAP
jgi:hypothetical protein